MKVTVRVPASSANLGSGVDTLGLALDLYLTAVFETVDEPAVHYGKGFDAPLLDDDNYVLKAAKELYLQAGLPYPALSVSIDTDIPLARGLGSSSAAIIAGLKGANALMDDHFSTQELIDVAARLEGHPDNVVPACLGGFTLAMMEESRVFTASYPAPDLLFVAAVPGYKLKTEKARSVLPKELPLRTCISQLQRACFLVSSLQKGECEDLDCFTKDDIFTPARAPLMPGAADAISAAVQAGAHCAFVSGAGPTILALTDPDRLKAEKIACAMENAYRSLSIDALCLVLHADPQGAIVTKKEN